MRSNINLQIAIKSVDLAPILRFVVLKPSVTAISVSAVKCKCYSFIRLPHDSRKALHFTVVLALFLLDFFFPDRRAATRQKYSERFQGLGRRSSTKQWLRYFIPLEILNGVKVPNLASNFPTIAFESPWFRNEVIYLKSESSHDDCTMCCPLVQFSPMTSKKLGLIETPENVPEKFGESLITQLYWRDGMLQVAVQR